MVLPVVSVGSNASEPIAFDRMPLLTEVQVGLDARGLVVFHTPPPAAPINTVQLDELQVGDTAIAVARPEKTVPAVAPVDSDETRSSAGTPLGPSSVHAVARAGARFAIAFAAFAAAICWAASIHFLGYARLS